MACLWTWGSAAAGGVVDPWSERRGEERTFAYERDGARPVLAWNGAMLEAFRASREYPPAASRALAMVHGAIFDAVNSIEPQADFLLGKVEPAGEARLEAAVHGAGRAAAVGLYPEFSEEFDGLFADWMKAAPEDAATSEGLRVGRVAAQRMLAAREGDGSGEVLAFPGGSEPGEWRPTFPSYRPALSPHWREVAPFALGSGNQFRPGPPPGLESAAYAVDWEEVRALGEFFSEARSEEQTDIALFWQAAPGTFLPPGHWNDIAARVLQQNKTDIWECAHLMALLNVALADAAVAAWDAKYYYGFWRPIDAIQLAEADGNEATAPEGLWTSYLVAPAHPEYPSGHSTFSGAAEAVLTAEFGAFVPFTSRSDGLESQYGRPELEREFSSFREAAEEGGRSRIYGGIHYEFSNQAGLELGRKVGDWVAERMLQRHADVWMIH